MIAPPKVYLLLNHVNPTTKIREEEERGIVAPYQLGKSEGEVKEREVEGRVICYYTIILYSSII